VGVLRWFPEEPAAVKNFEVALPFLRRQKSMTGREGMRAADTKKTGQ
jgi:hypothetical protein